ncbi:MAG: hypothetical protein CM1200mP17_10180 [Woeseia sp.]|nr:MAG: hypothetical protein CM1200mP17_10180 [Woeseia sp.]
MLLFFSLYINNLEAIFTQWVTSASKTRPSFKANAVQIMATPPPIAATPQAQHLVLVSNL